MIKVGEWIFHPYILLDLDKIKEILYPKNSLSKVLLDIIESSKSLVYCEQCRYYFGGDKMNMNPNVLCCNMKPTDYCSYGEARDD